MIFELTYRCNFNCRHCYIPKSYRKYGELGTREVFYILSQLADTGCLYLEFSGGEPFIRKDIMDILWYAKKKGFKIVIYTNGSLIEEDIVRELAILRPDMIDILIPAMNKDAFESISGVSGSRDKVFKAVELLHKRRVNLGFKTCVLKDNELEIKEIKNFAESLKVSHRLDNGIFARLDGSKEPYKYHGRLGSLRAFGCEHNKSNGLNGGNNLFKCDLGIGQAAITPLGELKMCVMIDYPKYKLRTARSMSHVTVQNKRILEGRKQEFELKDAWEKLKKLVTSIKPDKNYKCNNCNLKNYCNWCPAKAWLYNNSFTSCEPESKKWAEAMGQTVKRIRT